MKFRFVLRFARRCCVVTMGRVLLHGKNIWKDLF
jgi:hypothetical protein